MPKRIQRKRTKGWRMPPNTVYVGRPTKWGNPYPSRVFGENQALFKYKEYIESLSQIFGNEFKMRLINELHGKDLACWCPLDRPCHADVLLKLANGEVKT